MIELIEHWHFDDTSKPVMKLIFVLGSTGPLGFF